MNEINVHSIDGFKIGNAQNYDAATGCTVIICENGAVGGVDVRGGAPGTRETDLLNPINMMNTVHAVVLSGGSAFGLDAASGVMEYLEKKSVGFDVGVAKVPIVCSAVLFDLNIGSADIRPDKTMGLQACMDAEEHYINHVHSNHTIDFPQGNIGAGTGATVGKILGKDYSMKGGLGSFAVQAGDLKVGAIVAVNCFGDVVNPENGRIIAGALNKDKKSFASTEEIMLNKYNSSSFYGTNTTIAAIITNAKLTKSEANKAASMAHNGYAATIRPAHTMFDGDTIFSLCTGETAADVNTVGFLAARVIEKAVINAVKNADSLHNVISYKDFMSSI